MSKKRLSLFPFEYRDYSVNSQLLVLIFGQLRRNIMTPEDQARKNIDDLLMKAGWHIYNYKDANIHANRGVVVRHFPLSEGHGEADYLLYIDGAAAGVIEAKKECTTLKGV